jgi:hypothetical protein
MAVYEGVSQGPKLLEFAKTSVEKIAQDFDKPDADFMPTLLIKAYDRKVQVVSLAGDMNSQQAKDQMARFMFAAVACLRASEVAFVSSAWAANYKPPEGEKLESWEDVEKRDDFVMPRNNPDRIEIVNIMYAGTDGDTMSSAEITRHEREGKPPTIGPWQDMGGAGATISGRFGDAIHDGMVVGQKMGVAPPEIAEYMDEKIANGELHDLIESFLRAMDKAREANAKGQP